MTDVNAQRITMARIPLGVGLSVILFTQTFKTYHSLSLEAQSFKKELQHRENLGDAETR